MDSTSRDQEIHELLDGLAFTLTVAQVDSLLDKRVGYNYFLPDSGDEAKF